MKWPFRVISIIPTLFFLTSSFSQGNIQFFTSAGGNTEPSAILDIQSTDKGVLIPRMTSSERTAIQNPAEGLMVFQTDGIAGFYFCQNQSWEKVQDESESVPIGMVIEWWRPDSNFPVPEGYAICDGSTVSDPESLYDGIQLPNLLDNYVKGVTDPNEIGTTEEEGHSHDVSFQDLYSSTYSGNHTHDFTFYLGNTSIGGAHSHTSAEFLDVSSYGGHHRHKWSSFDSGPFEFDWISHNSSGSSVVRGTWGNGMDTDGVDYFLLGVSNPGTGNTDYYTKNSSHLHYMLFPSVTSSDVAGHVHNVHDYVSGSNYASPITSTEDLSHKHLITIPDATSQSYTEVEPPYIGLLRIIKIK